MAQKTKSATAFPSERIPRAMQLTMALLQITFEMYAEYNRSNPRLGLPKKAA